ncbi:MAG: ABC transporter substrate-binding protein [Alphaproteobacteria bacterium]
MRKIAIATLSTLLLAFGPAYADIKVGVIVGSTGPGASLGIPYKNTVAIMPDKINGEKVDYIVLDDATDASNATKHARKLINDDKVDLIMGSTSVPAALAIAEVANEANVPHLSFSPLPPTALKSPWVYAIPQPATIVMGAVLDHIKARGAKSIGYIGFNDSWGDLVLAGFSSAAQASGIKLVSNERYARADTSVVGQVLKTMAANPDAVVVGGSGTPGALPHITLVERGYKGPIYHNTGVINRDFVRVGGKNVEGAIAPTGPVMVAEQLPDSNPIKKVALEFTQKYEAKYGVGSRNAFAAYGYDAALIFANAAPTALKSAKPGTKEFRKALRDAIEQSKDVVGTHAVYSMSPTNHNGVDKRGVVLVRVQNGEWKIVD